MGTLLIAIPIWLGAPPGPAIEQAYERAVDAAITDTGPSFLTHAGPGANPMLSATTDWTALVDAPPR